jgi:membrane-associated phospholipid phosphatase
MQVEIIKMIQSIHSPFFDALFEGITLLGEEGLAILVGALLLWCINTKKGFEYAYMLLTGLLVNVTLKEVFDVTRPIGIDGIRSLRVETATGKSFPSGHTQTATMVLWWLRNQIRNPLFTIVSLILILGVAVSRLYLGVHWPLDVLAAMMIGFAWVSVTKAAYEKVEDRLVLWGLLVLAAAWIGVFFFYSEDYVKLLGALTGLTISMIVNQTWIHFREGGSFLQKLVVSLIGVIGVAVILVFGKLIFVHEFFGDLMRYMTLMIWVATGVPLISKKMTRRSAEKIRWK